MISIHEFLMTHDTDVFEKPAPPSKADYQQIMGKDEGWHHYQPRCTVCYLRRRDKAQNQVNTRTWSYCAECQVPLCCASTGRTCFETWHNEDAMNKLGALNKKMKEASRDASSNRATRPRPGVSRATKGHKKNRRTIGGGKMIFFPRLFML